MKISTIFHKTRIEKLISILFWVIIWEILSIVVNQEILLVSPFSAIRRLFELGLQSYFWKSILYSFIKISAGFLFGIIVGMVFSIISSYYRWFRAIIEPLVSSMQAIPIVCFIILCLIWIESKNLSIFVSFLVVFPVVYRNMIRGIMSINTSLKDVSKVYKVSKYREIRYIYMSETAQYLKSSIDIAGKMCWKAGIAAEVIGIPKFSIGENLYNAKIYLSTPDLFAWTIAILIVSVLFQRIILKIAEILIKKINLG